MDKLDELESRIKSGVSRLQGVEFKDRLELEIVCELIDGRKTMTELVEMVYGVGRGEEGFQSCYTRVRRGIKKLESKGFVSTRIFGKKKPYKLTDLAITNLARIGREENQVSLVSKEDLAVYFLTLFFSIITGLMGLGWLVDVSDIQILVVFGAFCYLLGISTILLARSLKRVI